MIDRVLFELVDDVMKDPTEVGLERALDRNPDVANHALLYLRERFVGGREPTCEVEHSDVFLSLLVIIFSECGDGPRQALVQHVALDVADHGALVWLGDIIRATLAPSEVEDLVLDALAGSDVVRRVNAEALAYALFERSDDYTPSAPARAELHVERRRLARDLAHTLPWQEPS